MSLVRSRLALVLFCWLALTHAPSQAQPAKGDGRKVVAGASATVYVKPDTAQITFGITTQVGVNAREENDKHVKKMREAIAGLAISNLEVQVTPTSVATLLTEERMNPFNPMGVPMAPVQTKQAYTLFVVTVRDKDQDKLRDKAIKVADLASEIGGSSPNDDYQVPRMARRLAMGMTDYTAGPRIDWLAENTTEARQEAIKKAIKIATENARAAAPEPLQLQEINVEGQDDRDSPLYAARLGERCWTDRRDGARALDLRLLSLPEEPHAKAVE